MARRTRIDGGWVVAYDGESHVLLKDASVLVEDDRIIAIGRDLPGEVDEVLGGPGKLIIPGLINTHVHASSQASERMLADGGRTDLFNTGFLNYLPRQQRGDTQESLVTTEDPQVGGKSTIVNLLRSGTTTMVELGGELGGLERVDEFVQLCGELGIRAYLSPGYAGAYWIYDETGHLRLVWDEAAGFEGLERAAEFIERHHDSYDGRIQGMLFPLETATTTPDLLAATLREADRLGVGISIHAAETQLEWHRLITDTQVTPTRFLHDNGMIRPGTILGHCVFVDTHSATTYPSVEDVALIAQGGAAVSHCPVVFARRGFALESFDRYRRAGVVMSLGTDSYPQDLLFEMKVGSMIAKVVDRSFAAGHARDLFNAATLGGAAALGREDIGRLAPGALADIVVVDMKAMHIGTVRDPISSLVHAATSKDIEHVLVGGRVVVDLDGVRGVDEELLVEQIQAAGEGIWEQFDSVRWGNKTLAEVSPLSYPVVDSLRSI
jgi:5-methylthioadenosine/S-adenosylhomocysteine deaminase